MLFPSINLTKYLIMDPSRAPYPDPGVVSSIPTWSHIFEEIYREIFSTVICLPPLIQEELLLVSCESMLHEWSFHMKFFKQVFGELNKFNMK